jgi:hypothetical protein
MATTDTIVISAFPGTGKTYLYEHSCDLGLLVKDSDSSGFCKSEFPGNYLDHIEANIGHYDVILVSSHQDVREGLNKRGISYTLVYPGLDLKDEYISRYLDRGSEYTFVNLVRENWDDWVISCYLEPGICKHVVLGPGEYIMDKLQN